MEVNLGASQYSYRWARLYTVPNHRREIKKCFNKPKEEKCNNPCYMS